jgi:hypothetical protein
VGDGRVTDVTAASERLWRARDGGLVRDGDPDGVALAYAVGDQIADADVDKLPAVEKAAKPAANKARAKAADK